MIYEWRHWRDDGCLGASWHTCRHRKFCNTQHICKWLANVVYIHVDKSGRIYLCFFLSFFLISSGPSVWVCRSSIVPACSRAKMCCVMCYISADSFTAEETVSNPTAQQIIILHYISGRAGQLTSHFFVCLVPSLVSDCISQVIAWVQAFFLLRCYFIGQCACIHACMRTNGAKFKYTIIIDVWHVWPFFKWIDCFSFLVFFLIFF